MRTRSPNGREDRTESGLVDCVLYFNPECSKSRAASDLLAARGVAFATRDYRTDPPDAAELRDLVAALGVPAVDLVRREDALAQDLGIGPDMARSDTEWIDVLVAHPVLLQRPLLKCGDRAVIARSPERMLELLPAS